MRASTLATIYLASVLATMSLTVQPATAQQMRPLSELAPSADPSYPLVRCAALFQALKEWAGASVLGQGTIAGFNNSIQQFIILATYLRMSQSGGDANFVSDVAARDVNNITDLYLARMKSNYATNGQGFGSDTLVTGDLALCTDVAAFARQKVEGR